ncbi:DUF6194 family protein [Leifsonia sp. NCR5]|uniref:DUF6194 family protein n=1 Tax=Leifsonia sp. NCR5 TaxID=1978342 RepID=UPI000A1984D8|nr:DUF6194 family protein [Leifsonia sp. NCR5]
MSMELILAELRSLPGVLELAPQPGSEHPELSWGDHFFYYAPDGAVPQNRQPYATIVTKDYPDDTASRLSDPDRWRLNIHTGPRLFTELVGSAPEDIDAETVDYGETDVFLPHPLYGAYGWVAVVNPGERTTARTIAALRDAHDADRQRVERRRASGS